MEQYDAAKSYKNEDSHEEIKNECVGEKDVTKVVFENLHSISNIEWDIEILEYLKKENGEEAANKKIVEFLQSRIQLYHYLGISEINNDILEDCKSSLQVKQTENENEIHKNYLLKKETVSKISSLQHKIEDIKPSLKNTNHAISISVQTSKELHAALRTLQQHQRLHPVKRALSPSYWKAIREYENEHEIQKKLTSNNELRAALRQEREVAVKKKAALDKELMYNKISVGELRKKIVRLEKEREELGLKMNSILLFEKEAENMQTILYNCIHNS